jgi:2-polyprenyl-6-methoxyphenol hydroxylase-like FAD-dependent oxidoreductase
MTGAGHRHRYDAIVVGARCAGAATAMLLARRGFDVLLVDRARFPSEIPHGHYVRMHGAPRLAAWGLLDRVLATERRRNQATMDDYQANLRAARFSPPAPEILQARAAARGDPQAMAQFCLAWEGRIPRRTSAVEPYEPSRT